jgi:hypothetical protein
VVARAAVIVLLRTLLLVSDEIAKYAKAIQFAGIKVE